MTPTTSRQTALRPAARTASRTAAIAALALALAGCTMAPMGVTPPPRSVTPPPAAGGMGATPAPLPGSPTASFAEQACVRAGRDRGLDVAGVVGSTPVMGNFGEAGRDVMLRVRQGGTQIDVRCNFATDTQLARIMLI
ncbi:MAG: hypothetical protein ACXIU7_02190 [Roseinatronobacter sp.]